MNLKAQAHHLKPIILVGKNGITENLIQEIDVALLAHELIKIKFQEVAVKFMDQNPEEWLAQLKATLVDTKGHVMTLHRKNLKKKKKV